MLSWSGPGRVNKCCLGLVRVQVWVDMLSCFLQHGDGGGEGHREEGGPAHGCQHHSGLFCPSSSPHTTTFSSSDLANRPDAWHQTTNSMLLTNLTHLTHLTHLTLKLPDTWPGGSARPRASPRFWTERAAGTDALASWWTDSGSNYDLYSSLVVLIKLLTYNQSDGFFLLEASGLQSKFNCLRAQTIVLCKIIINVLHFISH